MPMLWRIISGLLFALSVYMLIAGSRGRRVNDHPVCRGCKFDLVGTYPDMSLCPECGKKCSHKTVRIGMKRKRPGLVFAGAALIALLLAANSAVIVWNARGYDWTYFAPTPWLIARLDGEHPWIDGRILGELYNRHEIGELTQAHIDEIVKFTLERQANLDLHWHRRSGELFERLTAGGFVSPENLKTYFDQQDIQLLVLSRNQFHPDPIIPIALAPMFDRAGFWSNQFIECTLTELQIDGVVVSGPVYKSDRSRIYNDILNEIPDLATLDIATLWALPMQPGQHEIQSSWTLRVFDSPDSDANQLYSRNLTAQTTIEVVPESQVIVETITDIYLNSDFSASSRVEWAFARQLNNGRTEVRISLNSEFRKVAVAMEAVLIIRGQEWPMGTFIMDHGFYQDHVVLTAQLEYFDANAATLELRPQTKIAEQSLILTEILGDTVSYAVQIEWKE
jgi:hypothetical protein